MYPVRNSSPTRRRSALAPATALSSFLRFFALSPTVGSSWASAAFTVPSDSEREGLREKASAVRGVRYYRASGDDHDPVAQRVHDGHDRSPLCQLSSFRAIDKLLQSAKLQRDDDEWNLRDPEDDVGEIVIRGLRRRRP